MYWIVAKCTTWDVAINWLPLRIHLLTFVNFILQKFDELRENIFTQQKAYEVKRVYKYNGFCEYGV